jgi:hypothetical protein
VFIEDNPSWIALVTRKVAPAPKLTDLNCTPGMSTLEKSVSESMWIALVTKKVVPALIALSVRGTTSAEDAQGTTTQSHVSPSIQVYEEKVVY